FSSLSCSYLPSTVLDSAISPLFLVFFLKRPATDLDLPSFPTRRSSDLYLARDLFQQLADAHPDRAEFRDQLSLSRLNLARLAHRSEEHTSNSSDVSISYAVFCFKKKKKINFVL